MSTPDDEKIAETCRSWTTVERHAHLRMKSQAAKRGITLERFIAMACLRQLAEDKRREAAGEDLVGAGVDLVEDCGGVDDVGLVE